MTIKILDPPEPLSHQSFSLANDRETVLIDSDAGKLLRQEMHRYCVGSINGRSFLIAGHRGAGKTTLVANAFLETWKDSERRAIPMLRPLLIPLHGPSLFPHPSLIGGEEERAAPPLPRLGADVDNGAGDADAGDAGAGPDAPEVEDSQAPAAPRPAGEKSEAQIALEQITLGLHRAVAQEFVFRFRRHAERSILAEPPLRRPTINLTEVAAQFEVELYEGPSSARLYEIWRLAGALPLGILASPDTNTATAQHVPPEVAARGMREIVALSGVVEAYRRISGEYTGTERRKDSQRRTQAATISLDTTGQNLLASATAILTGGLAGAGLAASGAGGLGAAAAGIATALGAATVFKISDARSRNRSLSRDYQFVFDLTVATLDRVLPILIERLRAGGLAPIFVIDELDKVERLSRRMLTMVHHLKKLVAENAFFCFLTDRSYFEDMMYRTSTKAYPVEYTYFTHRLFITFRARDFAGYLNDRLVPPPERPATPPVGSGAIPQAQDAASEARHIEQDLIRAEERRDCTVLRWVLRHRAQLHPIDLQRRIAAIRDVDGNVGLRTGDVRSRIASRIDVTVQVAIEMMLDTLEVEDALEDDPELRRLVHDAFYFITRRWHDDAQELDLDASGQQQFGAYLESRMGLDAEAPDSVSKPPPSAAGGTNGADTTAPPNEGTPYRNGNPGGACGAPKTSVVTSSDLEFLLKQTRALASILCDDKQWVNVMSTWNQSRSMQGLPALETEVTDAVLSGTGNSFLIRHPQQEHVYQWRYEVSGRRRDARPWAGAQPAAPAAVGPPLLPTPDWQQAAAFIEHFAAVLQRLTA